MCITKKFNKIPVILFIVVAWLCIITTLAFSDIKRNKLLTTTENENADTIIDKENSNINISNIKTWLCYYSNVFGYKFYSKFDLVVLDSHNHPPLKHNKKGKPFLISYLSIGEVDEEGPYWELAKEKSYLVKKNNFWNSWIVDIRDPAWQTLLFDVAIPAIFKQGFDGLFLDTPDSSLSLIEGKDKEKYKGVRTALKNIIQRMKETYPDKLIILNRGLPMLPQVASFIDFVLIEDLYSYYAGDDKGYIKVDKYTQDIHLEQVQKGLVVNPDMKILTLDYAGYNQKEMIKDAIAFSRKKGFIPYVSTYKLDQIFYYTLGL